MSDWMNASQPQGAQSAQPSAAPFDPNFAFTAQHYDMANNNNNDNQFNAPDLGAFGLGAWPGQPAGGFTPQQTSQYNNPYIYSPNPPQQIPLNLSQPSQPPSLGPFTNFPSPPPHASPHLAAQLATHVAALDAIGLLQVRLQQLKSVLQSAIHPPGSSLAGTPLGPDHQAKLKQEITNTATRQQALVGQVKQFVAQNGGDSSVQPAVLAFRMQQQQIQQQQQNIQIQAGLASAGLGGGFGAAFPNFPTNLNAFNPNPTPPINPAARPVSPPTSSTPVPPQAAPLLSASPGGGPISPPIPATTPPVGALPPGLQAAMKARQAAKANAPPPPKPQLKKNPTSTSPTPAAEALVSDGRAIAGLPRPRGLNSSTSGDKSPPSGGKSATAKLAEAVPGLPTLTELHKQLKRDQFEASLKHVLTKAGVEMADPVKIEGREVALWDMWQVVMVEGLGGESVDGNSSWPAMASHLKLPSSPVAAAALQAAYHKQLSPYEDKWSAALLRQREQMMQARGISPFSVGAGLGGVGGVSGKAGPGLASGAGLQLQAEAAAVGLGQSLWQRNALFSIPAADEGGNNRFEELGDDDDEEDGDAAERRRKEPRKLSAFGAAGSAIPPPMSQAPPLLVPALAPLAASYDAFGMNGGSGLTSDPLLSFTMDDADTGGYGLGDLGAFGEAAGLGEVGGTEGMFGSGAEGGDVGGLLEESGFDFEQFLAGGGAEGNGLGGEFGGEPGYGNWQ